jgi:hypothetical protein
VAVVAGVGANVVNVFALGNLPDSMTQDWLSYGIAGLNPFMNVQSNGRAQQNLAGIDEVQRDKRGIFEPAVERAPGRGQGRQADP